MIPPVVFTCPVQLKKGKRTDSAALKPGTAVFVWNGKKYSHVGLYIGDGTVIEAMGTMSGVTTSKVTAGKWTHWGELNGVDYSSDSPAGGNTSPGVIPEGSLSGGKHPTLRKGDKGEAVREMQAMLDRLGYDLGSCGVDGDFGKDTEAAVRSFQSDHRLAADGVCGPATWAELEKAAASLQAPIDGAEAMYSVIISGLDLTQARALQRNYPGSVIEKEVG